MRSHSQCHNPLTSMPTQSVSDPTRVHQMGFQGFTYRVPRRSKDSLAVNQHHFNPQLWLQIPRTIKTLIATMSSLAWMPYTVMLHYLREYHRSCLPMKVKPGWMQLKIRCQQHDPQTGTTPLTLLQLPTN